MSLDQNLFTLSVAASTEEPTALDLTDPSSNTIHYRKRRHPDQEKGEIAYAWGMYDPLSESLLATITAASATAKTKLIELHNPSAKVELAFTGTLTFKWCFDWEGHTFEWRREACFMLRKPDPPVQVAVTREPAGRIKTSLVQLLDYNLNRFDIQDRKGLEIIMLSALLTFQDQSEEIHNGNNLSPGTPSGRNSSAEVVLPGKSGAEIVEQVQVKAGTLQNEVIVAEVGTVEDYAQHCVKMLKDESILYVVVKAKAEQQVPKVVQVAEAAKRMHYKSGGHDQELHQYVKWEDMNQKGPKVIKLDDPEGKKEYKPPQTIIIHLSKIPMPELQPKAPPKPSPSPPQSSSTSRPMNWFGFGAGPSDAKSSNPSLDKSKSSSATNLRPDSGTTPKLRPNSSHVSSSDSAQPSSSKPPQPAPSPAPPKDKNRKEKERKDRLKKSQETPQQKPPQASPHSAWPGPKPGPGPGPGPFGGSTRPSPSLHPPRMSSKMPGAFPPPSSPSGQPFYGGGAFPNAFPQQPHKPPPNPPAGFPPPSVPPPSPGPGPGPGGPQPAQPQPVGLTGALTNQLANVGYSLLDRLTHNTPSSRPK